METDIAGAVLTPPAPIVVVQGIAQPISVTIPEGYNFVNWTISVGSVTISNAISPTTTVTLTNGDVTLKANMELKNYHLILFTDGTAGAVFVPPSPITVQHGVSQDISVSVPDGYSFNGWITEAGTVVVDDPSSTSTVVTLSTGDATLRATFLKIVEVLNVTIPNATMKIGDVISATITVINDAEMPYAFVSGSVGGYPLYGFWRINATTYLANFVIAEGGNSYPANQAIPVSNLVITDGTIQSLPYNIPIIQNNDLLDAEIPVIQSMSVETGVKKIGDVVILNIIADGLIYSIHPSSNINGILVSESNVSFSELGGGKYIIRYTVEEGNNDVGPGELNTSAILVKPSGNIGLPFSTVTNASQLSIDAHPPVVTRMEVSSDEVGVGVAVRVAITADW